MTSTDNTALPGTVVPDGEECDSEPAVQAAATRPPAKRALFPRWVSFVFMPFLLAASISMAASAAVYSHNRNAGFTISPLVQLMGLSDATGQSAPGFTLTDQHGKTVSLAHFRGKAVLLAFMDTHCTLVCPVIAQEIQLAQRDLGSAASKVAFIGVNVNLKGESVQAVEQFSRTHGLSKLPNWYFLTGSAGALQAVWKSYGIEVILPKGSNQTEHADYLYFIGPHGHERYMASPQVDTAKNGTGYLPRGTLAEWGQGIATYLRKSMAS